MKTCAITMLKNEMSILPSWIAHINSLLDFLYVIDHESDDGTTEFLQDLCPTRTNVLFYREKDYPKKWLLDATLAAAVSNTDAEWFFFLDPDEFLPDSDRDAFSERLRQVEDDALMMRWRNCFLDSPGFPIAGMKGFRQRKLSSVRKIAIRREVTADPQLQVSFGAHDIRCSGNEIPTADFGELYHFPVRSLEHAWQKTVRGVLTRQRALQRYSNTNVHWHYAPALESLIKNPSWDTISQMVFDYGEPQTNLPDDAITEFEPTTFSLSGVADPPINDELPAPVSFLPLSEAVKAAQVFGDAKELLSMNNSQDINPHFRININKELINVLDWREKRFQPLPDIAATQSSRFAIYSAAQAMFNEIRYPVASAWVEHIPFMYALINLLRPRRFVELGVHNGASFLAACQEIASPGNSAECVAVDTWLGDPHAGLYEERVFAQFLEKLGTYREFAGYLRMQFDEAVEKFEDGSIDLLHIDGLHTAHAVEHDFQTWKSKLSSVGVVLFHDINEFRSDFGVWRVWRKLKDQFPYIEFGHGHGLGVLAVGKACPLRHEIEGWGAGLTSPDAQELLQIVFGNVGKAVWKSSLPRTQPTASSPFPEVKRRKGLRKLFWKIKRSIRPKPQAALG